MKLCDMNPHIRFASNIHYSVASKRVKVTDCRIFYILTGQAQLRIANQCYDLMPNDLFYCSAGSEYTIEAPNGFDAICLNFDLTQEHNTDTVPYLTVTSDWDTMPVNGHFVEDSQLLNGHYHLENAKELRRYLEKITFLFTGLLPYFREQSSCRLKELLILLHRESTGAIPPKVLLVKQYIDQNFTANITNKDIASVAGYHEYYLNRIFLASTGTSLHEYLLKVRLNHASHLILTTDLPLKRIPELVGFHGYPHFSSCFKQHFGFSPAEYRSMLRNM